MGARSAPLLMLAVDAWGAALRNVRVDPPFLCPGQAFTLRYEAAAQINTDLSAAALISADGTGHFCPGPPTDWAFLWGGFAGGTGGGVDPTTCVNTYDAASTIKAGNDVVAFLPYQAVARLPASYVGGTVNILVGVNDGYSSFAGFGAWDQRVTLNVEVSCTKRVTTNDFGFWYGMSNDVQVVIETNCGTPTRTPTRTRTATPSVTRTNTPATSPTYTPTPTYTRTATLTVSRTPTPSVTYTPTATRTSTPSVTYTPTPTRTFTPSVTHTRTATSSFTPSVTYTPTPTRTFTPSVTATRTQTRTPTPTSTVTASPTRTATTLDTATSTRTRTPTPSSTATVTFTRTSTPTFTVSFTPTQTATRTATPTVTPSFTHSRTITPGPSPTFTPTSSLTQTYTLSRTATPTSTFTSTRTATPTATPTHTISFTATYSATRTHTRTITPTFTDSSTITPGPSPTFTSTYTATRTATATHTETMTRTQSPSPTGTRTESPSATLTRTITPSFTDSSTITPGPSPTFTSTYTATHTESMTRTHTPSVTFTRTHTPTFTATPTFSETNLNTRTNTPTNTSTFTATPTYTATRTATASATRSITFTVTPTFTPSATRTASPSHSPTATISFTLTLSPSFSATPPAQPFKLTVRMFNAAGEQVKLLFDGRAQILPDRIKADRSIFAIGDGRGSLLALSGQFSGSGGLLWMGENDGGQMVSGGIYYFKAEYSDPFGKVTSLITEVQVMEGGPQQWLALFNSAGEMIREIPLGSASLATDLALDSPSAGEVRLGLKREPGGMQWLSWDGMTSQGLPAGSGTYTALLMSKNGLGRSTVASRSFAWLKGPEIQPSFGPVLFSGGALQFQAPQGSVAELYNLAGEKVGSGVDGRVPVAGLSPGIYILRMGLSSGGGARFWRTAKVALR